MTQLATPPKSLKLPSGCHPEHSEGFGMGVEILSKRGSE